MFDKVIMNPPYSGSLHLKILDTVIRNCPKAEIVNLSPVPKLQQYYFTKSMKGIDWVTSCKVEITDVIPCDDAVKMFGLGNLGADLGIWHITEGKTDLLQLSTSLISNFDIVKKYEAAFKGKVMLHNMLSKVPTSDYPLKFVFGLSLANHGGHGFSAYSPTSRNYATATSVKDETSHLVYLNFPDEQTRAQAWRLYTSDIMRWYYKNNLFGGADYKRIPFFTSETISDLIEMIGLTAEEVRLIRDEIIRVR